MPFEPTAVPKRTLLEISQGANSINVIGGLDGRLSAYQPLVCRVTDHVADTLADLSDPVDAAEQDASCAVFRSARHGEPWLLDANNGEHIVIKADDNPGVTLTPSNVTVLYPNYDYSTFV